MYLSAMALRISGLVSSLIPLASLTGHDFGDVPLYAVVVDGLADQLRQLGGLTGVEKRRKLL